MGIITRKYDYDFQYRAGQRNCNADCLSSYTIQRLNVNAEEVTEERKQRIISEMHNCPIGGHQGIHRTIERIKLYTSWQNSHQYVTQYIKGVQDTSKRETMSRQHQFTKTFSRLQAQ